MKRTTSGGKTLRSSKDLIGLIKFTLRPEGKRMSLINATECITGKEVDYNNFKISGSENNLKIKSAPSASPTFQR